MTLKERISRLFGGGEKKTAECEEKEKSTFVIFFKHSQRTVEFESTWEEINSLFTHFGGEKGLKMNNFFVPWSEVASIYEKDPEEEAPKAGDEMPATPETRALGAATMEVIEDPKDTPIGEVKASVEEEKGVKAEKI